ncbi:DUF1877 family protein [Mycetocola manganoxydans]|nr:DUF1877 family protein [Mycetocola manganoxydans]
MGIRYYAYPVDPELIEHARHTPWDFLSDDPLMDAWGPEAGRPEMLYLDKSWWELQRLLGAVPGETGSPAAELVRGQVREHAMGWYSFVRVLAPDEVSRIAIDLQTVNEGDVRRSLQENGSQFGRRDIEGDVRHVLQYLQDATSFTGEMARTGRGLIYLIG